MNQCGTGPSPLGSRSQWCVWRASFSKGGQPGAYSPATCAAFTTRAISHPFSALNPGNRLGLSAKLANIFQRAVPVTNFHSINKPNDAAAIYGLWDRVGFDNVAAKVKLVYHLSNLLQPDLIALADNGNIGPLARTVNGKNARHAFFFTSPKTLPSAATPPAPRQDIPALGSSISPA
jgi:hypothetical protein